MGTEGFFYGGRGLTLRHNYFQLFSLFFFLLLLLYLTYLAIYLFYSKEYIYKGDLAPPVSRTHPAFLPY